MNIEWKKMYRLNPNLIRYGTIIQFKHNEEEIYKVMDGDWDKETRFFEDFEVAVTTRALLQENQDILLYPTLKLEERRIYTNKLKNYFEDIKKNGYKLQKELPPDIIWFQETKDDEIMVAVDRHGHLFALNGWHRLVIAKILGLKEVPVLIAVRHKKWVDFHDQFISYIKQEWKGMKQDIYQPAEHIDFQDLTPVWGDYRYQAIRKNMFVTKGTLLDIGSLFGHFCHKFEDDGLYCTAVENNPEYVKYLKKFKEANYRKFKIEERSLFNLEDYKYDVILALNIFHHFLKTVDGYGLLVNLLKKINTQEMFVQIPTQGEVQMNNSYIPYDQKNFLKLISETTGMPYIQIGEELDRPIFKFYKR